MDNGQLVAGWRVRAFGDVLKLEYGKPLLKEDRDTNGLYPAYGANGIKCRTNKFYKNSPSIIVGRKGSAGEITLTEKRYWPLDVTYFVDFDEAQYDLMFLYYSLSSLKLPSLARGVKPGINRNDIYSIERAFPPLLEQKRIVAILDEAFAGISQAVANAEKNLANARELFESHLNKIFTQRGEGWISLNLKDLCTKITDGVHKKPNYVEKGIPFIKIKNLTSGPGISFEDISYISKEDHELFRKRTNPEKGDILITKDGTIGVVRIINTEIEFSIFVSVALIKPIDKDISPYLKYVLKSSYIQNQINPQGAALKHLYLRDLRRYLIPIAPESEQKKIVENLDTLSVESQYLESIYQQKLNALAELKQSILQKAFSGELRHTLSIIGSTPISRPASASIPKRASKEFIEAVLISQFVRAMSDDKFVLSRIRYNKLCYLAHRKNEDDVSQQYLKKVAGPYSPWAKYGGPERIALRNDYIKTVKRGEFSGFVVGPSIENIDLYISHYPVCAAVNWVVKRFHFAKTDQLELIATVDFAAMDIVNEGKRVNLQSVKALIGTNTEWAPKLKRSLFSDIGIQGALKELATLFPTSLGSQVKNARS